MASIAFDFAPTAPEPVSYEQYHSRRFGYLMRAVDAVASPGSAILDIGRGPFTSMLSKRYADVTTLGFACGSAGHIAYDLNTAARQPIPTDRQFDVVVFAEVIEHLHTAPETVLSRLREIIRPGGHLILQTPNAADLLKRLKLLTGRNPYERIRQDTGNPGHFREYTRAELITLASEAGYTVVSHSYGEYFGCYDRGWRGVVGLPILRAVAALVPSLARGQTLVLRA